MNRTLGVILCVLLAVQLVAADTAFMRKSTLTKLAARVKPRSKMVAPTVLGAGESADSHGVEPAYAFLAEHETSTKKQHKKTPEALAPKGTPSGIKRSAKAVKPTVQIATAAAAKAEEQKVAETVNAAKAEEQNLATALETVKAEEKKDDPNYQATAPAPEPTAAAPAAQDAATAAAEEAVGKEEEAVATAEKKVESEEAAVSKAVAEEEAVKSEVEGMEQGAAEQAAADAKGDCCKQEPEVTVGPKFIPAAETRSVLVVGNSKANAEKYNAVEASPKLLTDPAELKSIDEASEKTDEDIAEIGKKVEEISKAPLVPNPDGSISA